MEATMTCQIHWRALLTTVKEQKVDPCARELLALLELDVPYSREVYWKDRSMTELSFTHVIAAQSREDVTCRLLSMAARIGPQWSLTLSTEGEEEGVIIDGIADENIRARAVCWISFSVNEVRSDKNDIP